MSLTKIKTSTTQKPIKFMYYNKPPKNRIKLDKTESPAGWAFIVTAFILIAAFMFYPILYSAYLSTTSMVEGEQVFTGLANYLKLFNDSVFLLALKNTLIFLVIQVPIMLFLALILAALLNEKSVRFKKVFRTALFLPCVCSLVTYAIIFKMLFQDKGYVNQLLLNLHIISEPIPWLLDPFWAQVALIIAMTWRWTGYNMVFYLSALQNISEELYEAAEIDGASKIQQFMHITIPLLKPMILFTTIMSTITTLQLFDEPMNLSQAGVSTATVGPGNCLLTLSVYIYNLCFKQAPNFGYASTVAYVIVLIVAVLTVFQFKTAGGENT